jgi:hypothetical protein
VFNACATAASAAKARADGIRLGDYDIGLAVGMDKHPRGAFTEDPALVGMPSWYAQNGQYLTTKFFGMKANRYLHDHGISPRTLAKVAAKNFRIGALNPNAFRRKPIPEEEILDSPMLNYPLTQYMFCAPDEGAAAVVMCRADIAHRYCSKPVYLRAVEVRTRRYGAYEVNTTFAPVEEDVSPTVYASRAAFEKAGVAPEDVDVIQLQDTDARRDHSHGRVRFLRGRRAGEAIGRRGNGNQRPGCARFTNWCVSCAARRGRIRCAENRELVSPSSTARRAPRRPVSFPPSAEHRRVTERIARLPATTHLSALQAVSCRAEPSPRCGPGGGLGRCQFRFLARRDCARRWPASRACCCLRHQSGPRNGVPPNSDGYSPITDDRRMSLPRRG